MKDEIRKVTEAESESLHHALIASADSFVPPVLMKDEPVALKPCPMCGSGPAKGFGRYTNASFSGVEIMDETNQPYVWCGTCCLKTSTYDSIGEAVAAWNTRPADDLVRQLVEALKYNAQGWANAVEMGLLPVQHHETANELQERAHRLVTTARAQGFGG